ncbi:MAG: InlB B-repeat-containing protein, partial [Bulleidia sp.]
MEKNRKKHNSILRSCLNSALALAMFLSPITTIVAEDTSMPVSTEAPAETAAPAEEPAAEEQVVAAEAPAEEAPAEEPEAEPAEEAAAVQETEAAPTPAATPAATPAPATAAAPAPTAAAVSSAAPTAAAAVVAEESTAPIETVIPEEAAATEAAETPEPSAAPEATATPEPEEPEYLPAGTFTGSTSQMTVTVSYGEETFKTGTEMKVAYVSRSEAIAAAEQTASEDQEVIDAMAVDITFIDSDGNEVQPEGAVSVSMVPHTPLETTETSTTEVIHKDDDGSTQVISADASNSGADFTADSFSIYVISIVDGTPAIATYHFYDATGNEIAGAAQKVKDGETVYAPTTPEKSGSKFLGWSYTQNASSLQEGDPGDFATLNVSVSTTGDVNLYPVFQQAYYVFFMDSQGRVSTTKEGVAGDEISVSDVTIPLDSTHSVTGWYTEPEFTNKVDSVILSDHNVTLYPKVEEGHYLYFSSGEGASYVKPVFVAAGTGTAAPADPTRPGYTFSYWSASENGSEYTFGSTISEDTTLYAVWEADTNTSYTVIFWKQSVNDSKDAEDSEKTYDYAESVTRTGTTGASVSPETSDQN